MNTLQTRGKWTSSKRDMTVGDVVLIKDQNLPRNKWRLVVFMSATPTMMDMYGKSIL